MNDKLAHLSKEQIEDLIKRYYNDEKVKELIVEYGIDVTPSQLFKLFPPTVTENLCPYCNVNLEITHTSRGYSWIKKFATCPSCGHLESGYCSCTKCREKAQITAQIVRREKQEVLDSLLYVDEEEKTELDLLGFKDKIYLGALLREGISEDFNFIKPINSFDNPLAPTVGFISEILEVLRRKNFIVVHPNSDPEYFEDIDIKTSSFRLSNPFEVSWELNVKKEGFNRVALIDSLINPEYDLDPEETFQLWRKISIHESLEYLLHSVKENFGFEYSVGEKTLAVISDLINDYSVSQIYTILYRSTNNAHRFKAERGVINRHAANTIVGYAQSFAERAKVNEWDIKRYSRSRDLPESALSIFFFNRILKIGYDGFNKKPRLIKVEENDNIDD